MRRTEIESRANPKWKSLEQLLQGRGIKSEGTYLVSGEKLVDEALRRGAGTSQGLTVLQVLIASREEASENWLKSKAPQFADGALKSVETWALAPALFRELDVLGTHHPMLVLKTPEIQDYRAWTQPYGLVPLIPLGDPSNLGAVLRSAAAFGVQDVVLMQESASPFLPKAVKAAAGALWELRFWRGPALSQCEAKDLWVLDKAPGAKSISGVRWPENFHLLVGEEGGGLHKLPPVAKLHRLLIPMVGQVESLNAAVAMSLLFYEVQKTRSPRLSL